MKWTETSDMPCSVARTLSVIGDRWTMLILRNAFMRMRRFEDYQASLGMTRHLLSSRLKRLVEEGILQKLPYQQAPVRHEYVLTDKGKDLHAVMMALTRWGDTWMDQGKGPPMVFQHKTCGHPMTPLMVCSACHEPLRPSEVLPQPGPGLAKPKAARRKRSQTVT